MGITKKLLAGACMIVAGFVYARSPTVSGQWGFSPGVCPAPVWRAQWIWASARDDADMLLARKVFALPRIPDGAMFSITASSRYQLYVNGTYICSGPARCAPHHQSFDTLDISKALRQGTNVLAVRVHHQREAVSYDDSSRAGLLAQLDCGAIALQTDASWRVSPDEAWTNAAPGMARFHLDVCDRMDLRRRARGWKDAGFDDSGWQRATVLRREVGWPAPQKNDCPTHLTPPWTSLVARDIPYLDEIVTKAGAPCHVGNVSAPAVTDDWIAAPAIARLPVDGDGGAGDTIPANSPGVCRVLVFDLGAVQNGRPYLEVVAPAGTVVDVMAAPYLVDGNLQSPIVASTCVDRVVLSGRRERWDAFYMKPVRWMAVVFRHLPGEARLFEAGIMRSAYPFEQKGFLRLPDDPALQTLWDAAAKTIRVCTTDAYTDNYRERRQYAQTAYYACLGNYAVFGDHALQRRYLKQIAEEQLANGIMPAYAPRHGDDFMVILDSSCFWLRGLHQYLLYSGDADSVRALLPAARKLLALLHEYTNPAGLIDSPPYPYWLDHALNDRRGANFCLNAHYLGALEDVSRVLGWLNESGADTFRERAATLRRALREQLWDPERRLFADALVDGTRSDQFSEHANAMAMALKIGSSEQVNAIAAQLREHEAGTFVRRASGIVMVTPAMSYYLHAGLCEAGLPDASWDLLRERFAHMLAHGTNGTLWEEWWLNGSGRSGRFKPFKSGRSDAQTESAFPPALFTRYILGIEPTHPGLRDVILHYCPSTRLDRRHGAIPTPAGLLEVEWDIRPAAFVITLSVPPLTTVRIALARLGMPTADNITVNDSAPAVDAVRDGFLVVSPGKVKVRIARQSGR